MYPDFSTIQTDISKIQKGDWFLPMTIKELNQHKLIPEAIKLGAVGFTYEQGESVPNDQIASFSVPSLREYLFNMAKMKRSELNIDSVVVTGSAGKTSVKELVGAILNSFGPNDFFISPENQNTKIAIATQMLRLFANCKIAVFEMGADKVNDFKIPLSIIQPRVAALLNIGSAHVGKFGSIENLVKEKLSVLDFSTLEVLVIPSENPKIVERAIKTGKKIVTFGFSDESYVKIVKEEKDQLILSWGGDEYVLSSPYSSSAKGVNVAAAVAIALSLGVPTDVIIKSFKSFRGIPRRFENFLWGGVPSIDDAYNSSPESLELGLNQISLNFNGKKVLLVIGSMLELGADSERLHKKIASLISDIYNSSIECKQFRLVTIGCEAKVILDELRNLSASEVCLKSFENVFEAKKYLVECRSEFDMVYFKGSKAMQLQKIFSEL